MEHELVSDVLPTPSATPTYTVLSFVPLGVVWTRPLSNQCVYCFPCLPFHYADLITFIR